MAILVSFHCDDGSTYYYRFKVSLDDVVELMTMRNVFLSHQTMHNWVQTFGVELGLKCRARRKS